MSDGPGTGEGMPRPQPNNNENNEGQQPQGPHRPDHEQSIPMVSPDVEGSPDPFKEQVQREYLDELGPDVPPEEKAHKMAESFEKSREALEAEMRAVLPEGVTVEQVMKFAEMQEAIEERKKSGEPYSEDQVDDLAHMFNSLGFSREARESYIQGNPLTPEQRVKLLQDAPDYKDTPEGKVSAEMNPEEYEERKKVEFEQIEDMIKKAQEAAGHVMTDPSVEIHLNPSMREKMHHRMHDLQHAFEHKMHDIKRYFTDATAKDWMMRGVKYSSVAAAMLFLVFIWEMNLIAKASKKK